MNIFVHFFFVVRQVYVQQLIQNDIYRDDVLNVEYLPERKTTVFPLEFYLFPQKGSLPAPL